MSNSAQKPKIGLALGSGSARGWSHIGVINALKEMDIEPDIVAGCSIGALVGGAWATDYLEQFQEWVLELEQWDVIRLLDVRLTGGGMIGGERLMEFFSQHMGQFKINALPKAFAAVATELETGREIWLQDGNLLDAIRASIALPLLFTPVLRNGRWLSDGALVNPVPISLCRAMGAEIVIAVNLNGDILKNRSQPKKPKKVLSARMSEKNFGEQLRKTLKKSAGSLLTRFADDDEVPDVFDVLINSINIMQDRITRSRMAGDPADINIVPRLNHIGTMDFHRAEECIAEGISATRRARDSLDLILNRLA